MIRLALNLIANYQAYIFLHVNNEKQKNSDREHIQVQLESHRHVVLENVRLRKLQITVLAKGTKPENMIE